METLIEIIKELRAENVRLKESSNYWYGRCTELETPKVEENGND